MASVRRRGRGRRHGSVLKIGRASAWAEAVFHVAAHVNVPFASSCFNPRYVTWIASRCGPASERMLGDDVAILERVIADHQTWSIAQSIAWLFPSADRARAEVDRALFTSEPVLEVLRAAAELELEAIEALAPAPFDPAALDEALTRVAVASPSVELYSVDVTPPLGLRGRVMDDRIFVGLPGIAGATDEHVAWQVAHEATVGDVMAALTKEELRHPDIANEIERRALGLLRSRARGAGLGDAHGRWLAHLDLSALGSIPDISDGA